MSKITDFLDATEAFNETLATAIDGIVADVAELKRLIAELNANPDVVTPADQARIDVLQTKIGALSVKAKALDDETPPVAPPAP